jgi:hypothetical protein
MDVFVVKLYDFHVNYYLLVFSHDPNLRAERAFALAISISRFLLGAVVTMDANRVLIVALTSSTAWLKAVSLACEGFVVPQTLRTNCREAASISSCVAGGSKLNRVLMFLHMVLFRSCP